MTTATRLTWLTRQHDRATTWGVPWPRGTVPMGSPFGLTADGIDPVDDPADVPVQSRVTATWPDGSIKWSAHSAPPISGDHPVLILTPGSEPATPPQPVVVIEGPDEVVVDTGATRWTIPRKGSVLASQVRTTVSWWPARCRWSACGNRDRTTIGTRSPAISSPASSKGSRSSSPARCTP